MRTQDNGSYEGHRCIEELLETWMEHYSLISGCLGYCWWYWPARSGLKLVERNLELFLFGCGIIALTISGFASIQGYTFGWTAEVLTTALTAPLLITTVFGIPVGIVQIVLVFGLFLYLFFNEFQGLIVWTVAHTSGTGIHFLNYRRAWTGLQYNISDPRGAGPR